MASEDSTDGTTSPKREAAQAMAEVGGVRSSDDPVPDLWFGEPAGERRDATCSAEWKRNEGLVTAHFGLPAPRTSGRCNPNWRCGFGSSGRNSESRMRENRPSGLMRGGKQTVIGFASQPVASRLLYTFEGVRRNGVSAQAWSLVRVTARGNERRRIFCADS